MPTSRLLKVVLERLPIQRRKIKSPKTKHTIHKTTERNETNNRTMGRSTEMERRRLTTSQDVLNHYEYFNR